MSYRWENGNSISGKTIEVDNPATQKIIGKVPNCSTQETKNAIEAANKAFSVWKKKTAKERSVILEKMGGVDIS